MQNFARTVRGTQPTIFDVWTQTLSALLSDQDLLALFVGFDDERI